MKRRDLEKNFSAMWQERQKQTGERTLSGKQTDLLEKSTR
jgi:hypothetical protein